MNTPIYDFLRKYNDSSALRLHMPGHKGRDTVPLSYGLDITEIHGADSLFEADGIICESEKNASSLFGSKATLYSAGGSTLCIQTMLSIAKRDKRQVIAVRNVHRSFIAACVLLGIEPIWTYPDYSAGFLSGSINMNDLEEKLSSAERPCVYITSPDYLGRQADIKTTAELVHRYNGILIVDNAHGAHLAGSKLHPINQGADMCCDSAHKILPCLTGGAYLHIGNERYVKNAKQEMSLFASTSPSYLIMMSLDICNDYIEKKLSQDKERIETLLSELRERIGKRYTIYNSEPFHLTLLCDGNDLAEKLRQRGIECEYADSFCLVLLFSPVNTHDDISRLEKALTEITPKPPKPMSQTSFPKMERVMTIREAALSEYETVPAEKSEGRICAAVNVPCPPAVPIAVSGERINEGAVKIFQKYGILSVNVVK